MSIQEENFTIFNGLYTTLTRTRDFAQHAYYKIIEAQKCYFLGASSSSLTQAQEKVVALLDEALHKNYWGTLSLEQLWATHHHIEHPDRPLPDFYQIPMTTGQDEIEFLFAFLLDQVLYTWRSFLDYYLKYLLYFLTGVDEETISTRKFKRSMGRYLQNNDDDRCLKVFTYIKTHVLNITYDGDCECWGDLLRSLRDKTTHQKLIKPTLTLRTNCKGYLVKWPTIQGRNYATLAQHEFGNEAFEMIRELFPILYGMEWKTGPYQPGMFDK